MTNPLQPFWDRAPAFILDGGLATELEARGCDLNDPLWSARLLLENPAAIRQLHLDYLRAGADGIITATYQASIPGFARKGIPPAQAEDLLRLAVHLALDARDAFCATAAQEDRLRPLVAASVGPYGAYLADGSEYRGDYGISEEALYRFHRRRWQVLAASGADLLACETIPSFSEARVLRRLLQETPEAWAWFSFSCRDGWRISDGTPLSTCAQMLADTERVAAIGVNCTPPRYIPSLIAELRRVSDKPILVYPNSGEAYHAETRRWSGENDAARFAALSQTWRQAGARVIGGCCRTGPSHIAAIRQALQQPPTDNAFTHRDAKTRTHSYHS